MTRRGISRLYLLVLLCLSSAAFLYWRYPYPAAQPATIRLPAGFRLATFAAGLENARALALGDSGTVFVGTEKAGNVYALIDADRDGIAERTVTVAQRLDTPHGVAFRQGALYVATRDRILRYDSIETRLADPPAPAIVTSGLPSRQGQEAKAIRVGPDGMLYVTIPAPCDVCLPTDARSASIIRLAADGTSLEVFANGVRHSLGLDWDPRTGALWFTDTGRDGLGDHLPPDELDRADVAGLHFGFPFCFGREIADPEFAPLGRCDATVPAAMELDPKVGAMGMRFYADSAFPPRYRGRIFIAEYGSESAPTPVGYRVSVVTLENGRPTRYEPFAEGWVQSRSAWGRPADVLVLHDGSLLVSDDRAGAVYRISYRPPSPPSGRESG